MKNKTLKLRKLVVVLMTLVFVLSYSTVWAGSSNENSHSNQSSHDSSNTNDSNDSNNNTGEEFVNTLGPEYNVYGNGNSGNSLVSNDRNLEANGNGGNGGNTGNKTPATPVTPATPATPATPVTQVTQVTQVTPATPATPATPVTQVTQVTQVTPVTPATPVTQVTPVTPGNTSNTGSDTGTGRNNTDESKSNNGVPAIPEGINSPADALANAPQGVTAQPVPEPLDVRSTEAPVAPQELPFTGGDTMAFVYAGLTLAGLGSILRRSTT